MKLKNKVAIITGSTTGIGKATAEIFAKEGAKVVINCREQDECDEVASKIENAIGIAADVSKESDIKNLIVKTVKKFGKLDIFMNNAGVLGSAPLEKMTEQEWDRVIDINLKGSFFGIKHAAKQMLKQGGGGKIINVASIAGLIGYPMLAHYCSSKGGVIQLTRTAAMEFAQKKINVNAIAPGLIETPMTAGMMKDPAQKKALLAGIPMKRAGKPEEIGYAALYLASGASDYLTGQVMVIDGGWTSQ